MSQSISNIMAIFIDELESLGANIGSPELIAGGMMLNENTNQFNIQTYDEEFLEIQIRNLAKAAVARAQTFYFKELILPKSGVEIVCNCRKGNVLFRYLEAYEMESDRVVKQIDILV